MKSKLNRNDVEMKWREIKMKSKRNGNVDGYEALWN